MGNYGRILSSLLVCLACTACADEQSLKREYIENEDWAGLLELYDSSPDSLKAIDVSYINIALAAQGQLGDKAFNYLQGGPTCLFPDWNRNPTEGEILTDIYYQAGHIALARRMAFEADELYSPKHSNRMMKRLVQCALIYEDWPVAEKYICYLEWEGGKWKEWAQSQRRFLHHPEMIEQDAEYGMKRKCIPTENFIADERDITANLKHIMRANPEHRNTVEILGVYYLLALDFQIFKDFLDEYYGTEILPELPRSFAEAACLLSEMTPGYWKTVGVPVGIYREYVDFKNRMAAGLSPDKYSGTYWVYVMKLNTR